MAAPAPLLVLGVGNPSRGDDALGPLFIAQLEHEFESEVARGDVELLTDFQLQIEHSLDLKGRSRVVFVDASTRAPPPFEFARVTARPDTSCTTHALSPQAVLATHQRLEGEPPESWLLAIRGERFELGDPLSLHARAHLDAALSFFVCETRGQLGREQGKRIEIEGTVQGVGFRPWVYRVAHGLGLSGTVHNTSYGVGIDAFGSTTALDALVAAIQHEAPRGARVRALRVTPLAARNDGTFRIVPSVPGSGHGLSLAPDLGTCEACSQDIRDPTRRHYGYAFTSCAECGPRFSITNRLPYDRDTTTLRDFERCPACQSEYERPDDRRFGAEATACPECGPRVWLSTSAGEEIVAGDPIASAAALLREGKIVGVQGIGAFHLACAADDGDAVARLRRRKRRDAQPFAVMVANPSQAEALVTLDAPLRAALTDRARPIVLAPSRPGALPEVVNGPSRRTGVMLPYTPLHELLLEHVGRPLVMTSGNTSGGPAVCDRHAAPQALGAVVDAFLFHDRVIARRVEDSVVAASSSGLRVLRRARGYAPLPVRLPLASPEPVLAVGGHLKNTACVVVGDQAYLTPHLGDLHFAENERAWQREVTLFERLLGVHADVVAHDSHPDYATTRLALARPARRHIAVQHHLAHVLSAVAELHLDEPVIGVVFDGSGFGTDGTSWGAEFLLVDGPRWTRAHSFRALPLAGGERAIHEVWRVAFGALHDAFGPDAALEWAARLPVFEGIAERSLRTLSHMIASGAGTVRARGIGRWFDAVGALVLGLPHAAFEAHVAIALEQAADPCETGRYPVALPQASAAAEPLQATHEIDLRPTVRALVHDLARGVSASRVAARFHQTVLEATSATIARLIDETGIRRVVPSGGAFQNLLLERGLYERLGADVIRMAREVPLNDGGLCLGQAFALVLALRSQEQEVC